MKILSPMMSHQGKAPEQSFELREGEVYSAKIKEKVSENEAIVQIKGKDVKVQFEGQVPQKERVLLQVSNKSGEVPIVKTVVQPINSEVGSQDLNKVLSSLGINSPSADLKKAIQLALEKEIPLSKETIRDLQIFLERGKGDSFQKLETIRALLSKNIDITFSHLSAIHEALYGEPLSKAVKNIRESLSVERSSSHGNQNSINQSQRDQEKLNQILLLLKQESWQKDVSPEIINKLKHLVLDVSNKLTTQAKQIGSESANPETNASSMKEASTLIESVLKEVGKLPEHSNIRELSEAILGKNQLSTETYETNSAYQTGVPLATKDLIVTEITQKLALAAEQFKSLKKEITRNLAHIIQMVQATKTQAIHHTKPLLESSIDVLDKAMLKSEITTLTDMKTEKQLMQASSELARAKQFLEKGKYSEARRILGEVKEQLQKMNWQPSDVKVKHFLTKESLFMEDTPKVHKLPAHFENTTRMVTNEPSSARNIFELIRSLGINHDSEVAQNLTSSREQSSQQGNQEPFNRNIKALIMQSLKGEQELTQSQKAQLQQALQSITGQQLLSKADGPAQMQSMFFNLPFALGSELKDIKVYINSQKGGEKVDWENCSVYFLLETKRIGETGILISASNRNLSITIKNNHPNLKQKLGLMVEGCKENLKAIGYHIAGVQFTRLTEINHTETENIEKESRHSVTPKIPAYDQQTKKGFDFKV